MLGFKPSYFLSRFFYGDIKKDCGAFGLISKSFAELINLNTFIYSIPKKILLFGQRFHVGAYGFFQNYKR